MQKGKNCQSTNRANRNDLFQVPVTRDASDAILVSPLLPKTANVCSGGTGIACNQVAGSNSARKVSGFREVRALVATSKDGAVPTRCNRTPRRVLFSRGDQSQGIFGVNQFDGVPSNVMGSENVDNSDSTIVHLDSWNPIHTCNQGDYQGYRWNANQRIQVALAEPDGDQCKCENRTYDNGYHLTESGSKDLHHNNLSLGATA